MTDDSLTLVATGITYYSPDDETAFFQWLDRLECVDRYWGQLRDLFIELKRKPTKTDLQDLIALFHRYRVDMRQLARFETRSNRKWLRHPGAYWHAPMFGHGEGLEEP